MTLNLEITIGDILTAVVILTGVLALYFQARSVRISEKQLQTNINDLTLLSKETKELAEQIKKERQLREDLTIEKMTEYAEQMNYTSHVYGEAISYQRHNRSVIHEHVMTIILGMRIILEELKTVDSPIQKSNNILELESTLQKMLEFIIISDKWDTELEKASNESAVRREQIQKRDDYTKNLTRLLSEENGRHEQHIAQINTVFGQLIEKPRDNYRASYPKLAQIVGVKNNEKASHNNRLDPDAR